MTFKQLARKVIAEEAKRKANPLWCPILKKNIAGRDKTLLEALHLLYDTDDHSYVSHEVDYGDDDRATLIVKFIWDGKNAGVLKGRESTDRHCCVRRESYGRFVKGEFTKVVFLKEGEKVF